LKIIAGLWDSLTGRSAYHNWALRHINDWAETVSKFLDEYGLDSGSGADFLIENSTRANVDLISMAYKGNALIKPADKIKGGQVLPLLVKAVDELENTRRALMNPSLRATVLPQVLSRLRESFQKLREKLAAIESI